MSIIVKKMIKKIVCHTYCFSKKENFLVHGGKDKCNYGFLTQNEPISVPSMI